ncbi:MAG: glycosyltransferase [Pseudomonadota bacterium]
MMLLAAVSLVAWLGLLFAHHGFWRADQRLAQALPQACPPVLAIVPARNEAATVDVALRSLLTQDYLGQLTVIVVDDHSSDGTGDLARSVMLPSSGARQVVVVDAPPLPEGWSGKVGAQRAGLEAGVAVAADSTWLWLTDADIAHPPDVLSRLVAKAEAGRFDLVSLMVKLGTTTPAARWLVPAFVYFFQLLYPFGAVNDPKQPEAAAAGGCILVERARFERVGGFAAIAGALIDDVALAKLVKGAGGRLWIGLADASRCRRVYRFAELWAMVARTAFTELRHSYVRLVAAMIGLGVVFLAPPLALALGDGAAQAAALLAWGLMAFSFVPTMRDYGLGTWRTVFLPAVALLYMAMTLDSALTHARGRGARWRGRAYGA